MSSSRCDVGSRLAMLAIAFAASPSLFAAERHNIVLFVPELLSAGSAEDGHTPTLTRLRDEGVNFLESHSRFPSLAPPGLEIAAEFNQGSLIEAATAAEYSATFLQDEGPIVVQQLQAFKRSSPRPFFLIYRVTGNSPKSADETFAAIEASLKDLGLYDDTNIIVAAENGSAGVWKASRTSLSLAMTDEEEENNEIGELPTGFLAIDVAAVMQKAEARVSLFDPDQGNRPIDWIAGEHPLRGNAIIGENPTAPRVVVEARGGHDFLHLPAHLSKRQATDLAQYIVGALFEHDYVSGVFVNEKRVGRIRGALSQEHLGWRDTGSPRVPDIVVNFASVTAGCKLPMTCAFAIADTPLEEGDEIRGAFSRADTWTFMAARGPDFHAAYIDRFPASNADIARTILELLARTKSLKPRFGGRVLTESLRGYEQTPVPEVRKRVVASKVASDGLVTEVVLQTVGAVQYFDAAGFPGWTVGIQYKDAPLGPWWHWEWPHPRSMTVTISPN